MTAIAGVAQDGRVYIGGDSLSGSTGSYFIQQVQNPKVLRLSKPKSGLSEILLGFTSSWRMGQLLQYQLKVPDHKEGRALDYVAGVLIESIRKTFTDYGFGGKGDDGERGGSFLVGYGGTLFEVQTDYSVMIPMDMFAAVGCAFEYALGALHATPPTMPPRLRIIRALEAAEHNSAYVHGPFMVEELAP